MATLRPLTSGELDAITVVLAGHPFCEGLAAGQVTAMAEGATHFELGAGDYLLRHGAPADALTLLLDGDVELQVGSDDGPMETLEALHAGDAIGWSWLFPPHAWVFDVRCRTEVTAIRLDGTHLHALVETDPVLGRELALRIGALANSSLHRARARLAEVLRHDQG